MVVGLKLQAAVESRPRRELGQQGPQCLEGCRRGDKPGRGRIESDEQLAGEFGEAFRITCDRP